jgi:hypothetical protein
MFSVSAYSAVQTVAVFRRVRFAGDIESSLKKKPGQERAFDAPPCPGHWGPPTQLWLNPL